jgi:peroxiredoxin Q/BCP
MLNINDSAPQFSLLSNEGSTISLVNLKGKNVVLYFYPKDDTPGCTIEAQDFNNKLNQFSKLNCIILGISKDNFNSHCKFVDKYSLKFLLLCDETSEVCQKYQVLVEKSMFGKKYIGIDRSTFLIDKMGKIVKIWQSVKVNGHVDEVLAEVTKLI